MEASRLTQFMLMLLIVCLVGKIDAEVRIF